MPLSAPAVLALLADRKGHDLCIGLGRPAWSSAHLPMARGSALLMRKLIQFH
jgi:hypothetical protein